ncbi:hypothetical protein MMIC_P0879 [Mariprofundus micogutta]|uniref:Uncharacterized protein n=1 Tax=Mariprofundus micogutta TaxID=1921010 RepID=A0A1L8CLW8_9PROT|nr:hypothetical protein [Mariprofundus micogutta]GAV19920.1 hypothetical protein MMIC_P0879 [Mariprofundus micogutta]
MSQKPVEYADPVIKGLSAKVIQYFRGHKILNEFQVPEDVLEDLRHSVKFSLGPTDELPFQCDMADDGLFRSSPIHLEFDLMCIEFISNEGEDGDHDVVVLYKRTSPTSVRTFLFSREHGNHGWICSPSWAEIETRECGIHRFITIGTDDLKRYEARSTELTEQLQSNSIDTCKAAIAALMGLHALIECNNIAVETVPAPKVKPGQKLGKLKREFLKFEYRILTIKGRKTYEGGGAGSHRSPRLHLRRGHIRKLPTGKTTWVSSCAVGSGKRGVIQKDYSVEIRP